jgi:rare lipoprotein A
MRSRLSFYFALTLLFLGTSLWASNAKEEYGIVAYYADNLHGRKTASGEKYNKNEYTCAHKTYPFGTRLRVTRLDNDQSVIVRVNDRGPFKEGHVVDISRAAALEIDLITKGKARVKVEPIDEVDDEDAEEFEEEEVSSKSAAKVKLLKPAASNSSKQLATYSRKEEQKGKTRLVGKGIVTYGRGGEVTLAEEEEVPENDSPAVSGSLFKVDLKATPKRGYGVQVSTMYDADNVLPIVTKLQKTYPGKVLVHVESDEESQESTYRIIIGAYGEKSAANAQQKKLAKSYSRCFVVDLSEM